MSYLDGAKEHTKSQQNKKNNSNLVSYRLYYALLWLSWLSLFKLQYIV